MLYNYLVRTADKRSVYVRVLAMRGQANKVPAGKGAAAVQLRGLLLCS
jgi:hypothetical protein